MHFVLFLLSNGTLITREIARRLRVHEVQVSLDGMREGHESIRGEGTFEITLKAIDNLQDANIRVSIATMIHRKNLKEFDKLGSLIQSKDVREWNVDVPSIAGRMGENKDFWVSPSEAGPFLQYGYGGGLRQLRKRCLLWAHLCAILPMVMFASADSSVRTQWDLLKKGSGFAGSGFLELH
jgi:sulfatase maturation enzyme AslB (radical SAM superfamily)